MPRLTISLPLHYAQVGAGDIMFPVDRSELFRDPGDGRGPITAPRHRAVYRTDTGAIVGVVGARYRMVPMAELVAAAEPVLDRFFPDVDRAICDRVSHSGSRVMREYLFTGDVAVIETDRHRTEIMFRVILINSYDGFTAVRMLAGAIDALCANGMIYGAYDTIARRHTSGLRIENFADALEESIARHARLTATIRDYAAGRLAYEDGMRLLSDIRFGDRKAEELSERYRLEIDQRGPNFFALVSALTYRATYGNKPEVLTRPSAATNMIARQAHMTGVIEQLWSRYASTDNAFAAETAA